MLILENTTHAHNPSRQPEIRTEAFPSEFGRKKKKKKNQFAILHTYHTVIKSFLGWGSNYFFFYNHKITHVCCD